MSDEERPQGTIGVLGTPSGDYSPDEIERNGAAIDQAEQEARHRTVANSRHAGTEDEGR